MKKIRLLSLFLWIAQLSFAQGIIFHEGSLDEAFEKARRENKLLFVDLYTTWCGPCKMVAKTVFPQSEVGKYYNQNFINCKLDGEKGKGAVLVKKYGVQAYPTFLFLDGEGNLVYSFKGAKDAKGFIEEANKIGVLAQYGGWEKMQADYHAGKDDPAFLWDYYKLVGKSEKDKVLNKYLKALPDEELFVAEMGKLIEKIKLYDYDLLKRLVEGRVNLGKKDADFDFLFTFPLQWKLTNLFDKFIAEGNRKCFDEVMSLKNRFNMLAGTQDRDVEWKWGRGLFFLSPELINLCYYYENRYSTDQFKLLVADYMESLMQKNPLDSLVKAYEMTVSLIRENPLMATFMKQSLEECYKLMASAIVDWADYYWSLVPSDKIHREQCAAWVNYACKMNPYTFEIPVKAVNLLIRLKHKKEASLHLENAIKAQNEIGGEDTVALNRLKSKLRAVMNGKE